MQGVRTSAAKILTLISWNITVSAPEQLPTFSYVPVFLDPLLLDPLRAKSFRGSVNIYLHFVSFLHIDVTQVVGILPQIRQEPTYST